MINGQVLSKTNTVLVNQVHVALRTDVIPRRKLAVLARLANVSPSWLWRFSQQQHMDYDRVQIMPLIRVYSALQLLGDD